MNPPREVPTKLHSGEPPYPGWTTCHSPKTTAANAMDLRPAAEGRPTSARRKASSSVTSSTAASTAAKNSIAPRKGPTAMAGRSTTIVAVTGTRATATASAYQRHSVAWPPRAVTAPRAAVPASSAAPADQSPAHSPRARATFPSVSNVVASTHPTASPRSGSGAPARGPSDQSPSCWRARSSTARAAMPALSDTAVTPAAARTPPRRGAPHASASSAVASARRHRQRTSGELDMSFADPRSGHTGVDEQRSIGTHARRAAEQRRAQLTAAEPVAFGEGRTLGIGQPQAMRRQAGQRRHQAVEHVETSHRRYELGQRRGAVGEGRWDRVRNVHPDPQREPLQRLTLPAPLAQNARELAAAIADHDVVGPLEACQRPAGLLVHHVGDHEPRTEGKCAQVGLCRAEQHAEPDPAGPRVPRAAVPAPPRRLLLGEHDGAGRCALGTEIVDRVKTGRESLEHPALRHAPPLGEARGRNTVQL